MAATRENVLAAITRYVESNKRRAPAKAIAEIVDDTLPTVQAIIKALVGEGILESSRGRNGGAKLVSSASDNTVSEEGVSEVVEHTASEMVDTDVAAQFAALVAQIEASEAADNQLQEAVG